MDQASKLTSPNPLTMICTLTPSGRTNLATASWWTYLSFNPGMVGFALAKTSYSGKRIKDNGQVVLAMPGAKLAKVAMACGRVSGREVDKALEYGIELETVPDSAIKIPAMSRLALLGELKETLEVGDHRFYVCAVRRVWGDASMEGLFAWDGYSSLRPAKP